MVPRLVEADYVTGFTLSLRFSDGTEGEIDLEKELWGAVFEPLRDIEQFRQFSVHPELHTLTWENGADFSPEFLYASIKVTA